jgi:cytosine/adenosine deaminase-related metal-dependent hydrolase
VRLAGLVLPGFADAHGHAFHRALRGRTHDRGGTFWTWRERMFAVAGRLDPDSYLALARAVYAEMALGGVTCVGEFHYLHHGPDGRPYAEPHVLALQVIRAAREVGLRITLLQVAYARAGHNVAPNPRQLQKSSTPEPPALPRATYSVRPRMRRWKACECALTIPGSSTRPGSRTRSASSGRWPSGRMRPSGPTASRAPA